MIETETGDVPDQDDLERWADTYGLTMPVLADEGGEMLWRFAADQGGSVGLPFTVILDEGVVIDTIRSGSQETELKRKF